MRPEYLPSPFKWENRKVLIKDSVLYVPNYYANYDELSFPGWYHPEVFTQPNPIHIEYCSGNGKWICERALKNPEINYVAVEKRFDRVRKIWSKLSNHSLKNLFIVCGEGLLTTQRYFPKNSVEAVYVNFPDPWPKERHAKHRIIQTPFVEELRRILSPLGSVHLVTDDVLYKDQMIATFREHSAFSSAYADPYYATSLPEYGDSWFQDLWEEKARTIHHMKFEKTQ